MLRVKVDPKKKEQEMMASIDHELRHAVEVLGNPAVTSNAAMFFFYEKVGRRRGFTLETDAAIQAGNRVRDEVRLATQTR